MSTQVPATAVPIPVETPIVNGFSAGPQDDAVVRRVIEALKGDRNWRRITEPWANYLSNQSQSFSNAPQRVASASVTNQNASIGLTTLPTSGNAAAYRVTYLAEITVAAGVSSSLEVTITWTHNGLNKTVTGVAITGNTNTTTQSASTLVLVDANTALSYSTTYASNAAGIMHYAVTVVVEQVNL